MALIGPIFLWGRPLPTDSDRDEGRWRKGQPAIDPPPQPDQPVEERDLEAAKGAPS